MFVFIKLKNLWIFLTSAQLCINTNALKGLGHLINIFFKAYNILFSTCANCFLGCLAKENIKYKDFACFNEYTYTFMYLRAILCTFQISVDFYYVPVGGRGGGRGGAGRGGE